MADTSTCRPFLLGSTLRVLPCPRNFNSLANQGTVSSTHSDSDDEIVCLGERSLYPSEIHGLSSVVIKSESVCPSIEDHSANHQAHPAQSTPETAAATQQSISERAGQLRARHKRPLDGDADAQDGNMRKKIRSQKHLPREVDSQLAQGGGINSPASTTALKLPEGSATSPSLRTGGSITRPRTDVRRSATPQERSTGSSGFRRSATPQQRPLKAFENRRDQNATSVKEAVAAPAAKPEAPQISSVRCKGRSLLFDENSSDEESELSVPTQQLSVHSSSMAIKRIAPHNARMSARTDSTIAANEAAMLESKRLRDEALQRALQTKTGDLSESATMRSSSGSDHRADTIGQRTGTSLQSEKCITFEVDRSLNGTSECSNQSTTDAQETDSEGVAVATGEHRKNANHIAASLQQNPPSVAEAVRAKDPQLPNVTHRLGSCKPSASTESSKTIAAGPFWALPNATVGRRSQVASSEKTFPPSNSHILAREVERIKQIRIAEGGKRKPDPEAADRAVNTASWKSSATEVGMNALSDVDALKREAEEQSSKAIRDADSKRRAEFQQKEKETRQAEERKYTERQAVLARQRALLKRQAELFKERHASDAGLSALAKLQAVNKAAQTRRNDESHAQLQGSASFAAGSVLQRPEHRQCSASDETEKLDGAITTIPGSGELASTPLTREQETPRQERIKAKEEMNRKKQQAEETVEDVEDLSEGEEGKRPRGKYRSAIVPDSLPAGAAEIRGESRPLSQSLAPTSLHRLAEQRALSSSRKKKIRTTLDGKILPQDVHVLRSRRKRVPWAQIVRDYERLAGRHRGEDFLRNRYRLLEMALDVAGVEDALLDAVLRNDAKAIHSLNERIYGDRQVAQKRYRVPKHEKATSLLSSVRTARPDSSQTQTQRRAPQTSQAIPESHADSTASIADSLESLCDHTALNLDSRQAAVEEERPEFGGKTLNWRTIQHYQQCYADRNETEGEEEAEEAEPVAEEDRCHFVYQIQRRQISKDELDAGEEIENALWSVCGNEYLNVDEANTASFNFVFRVPHGLPNIVSDEDEDTNELRFVKHDRKQFITLRNEHKGMVQVRVAHYMRDHHDGIIPPNDTRMISRTAYQIMQATSTKLEPAYNAENVKKEDEVPFSASPASETKTSWEPATPVDKQIYGALEIANERAIRTFVQATFRSQTTHLTARQAEIQKMEKSLLEQLDEEDLFDREGGRKEGKGRRIKVWVEKRKLVGPRN